MAANNNHFELTLDTLAPTGSISRGDVQAHNANYDLTIVKGVASYMKVWKNTSATGAKTDEGYTGGSWIAAAETFTTDFSTNGDFYYHLVLMDSVGNESDVYNTAIITFDNVQPVVSGQYLEDKDSGSKIYTNEREVKYHFAYSDAAPSSGVVSGRIAGDCTTVTISSIGASPVEGTLTLTEGDELKTVIFYVTDAAGNESVGQTASITLDTALTKPVITLLKTDGTTTLPSYINYHDIKVNLKDSDTDIVAYKIWESGSTEPAYTEVTKGALDVIVALSLSEGDGIKTVCAKVKDQAGSESAADNKTVTIDTVAPVVALTRTSPETGWISNVTGYTSATIHIKATDATAGVKNWTLTCNGSNVETGNGTVDKDITVTSSTTGMDEGANSFVFTAWDNADTFNQNSVTVADLVKLDTTIPEASITALNTWYKAQFAITANTNDAGAGVATIYAWTSMTAGDESCPAAAKAIARTAAAQSIPAADITWALEQSAANYMHIKVVDAVGNINYAHAKFGYDSVAPEDNGSKFHAAYYATTAAQVDLAYIDATSGVAYFKVTGSDIDNPSTDWEAIGATRAVTLNGNDGTKTVNVYFKDNAGNESAVKAITTELDRSKPTASQVLKVVGEETAKPSVSNIRDFDAWISYTDDSIVTETMQFKYYGPGIGKADAGDVEWENFTPATGKTYQVLTKQCTTGDGLKQMYVQFKDGAGNISDAALASFTLDTTAPEPEAKDVDFSRISKVHVQRIGETTGKMCDEIHFTLDPKCTMQAFKVCAYVNQAAAIAGTHEDNAIPTTDGSQNMSGSGLSSEATVACMIKGTDYENALLGQFSASSMTKAEAEALGYVFENDGDDTPNGVDGLHYVVVYVQDIGGNWSAAASFTA